ncbi:hypothetical protein Tco_0428557 [Tanacetum coccineum]
MASLDHRLNPLFSIKECMTCRALYIADFCCSIGGLEDKIIVPKPSQNCATCGNPVDGLYCRSCAFVRRCLNEGWYTIHDENEILSTSESSNHNTNVVSTPQEPFVSNQDPGVNSLQSPLQSNHNYYFECGDSLDGIFCQRCTCKSCGNGAHIGYNCQRKALIISNPEQCNQTINELPQTLPSIHPTCNYEDENSFTYDSKPNSFNDSPSVLTYPPQLQFENYLGELCGNNAHYGYDCLPQFPLFPVNYPPQEISREILQDQGDLMKAIQAFLKDYDHIPPNEKCMALLLAEERSLKIKQVMREEHNQPKVMQELLLKLMDDLQILKGSQQEKKETATRSFIPYWNSSMIDNEEARDNFLKDVYTFLRNWNRPLFYFDDNDDEYTVIWRRPKAITSDEPSREPEDPLIMGENELCTIPEKEKSSVEDLVQIPSGSKGVSDDICDNDHSDAESLLSQNIPITSPKINFLSEEFTGEFVPIPLGMDENEFDEEEDDCYNTTSDDDSYENIEYVEASPLNLEYDCIEEENEDQEEKEFDLEDIFQIQDVILREKLLNINRLISNIESLKNNPTPDYVLESPSSFPILVVDSDSFFEESDTSLSHLDNSLPEFETFSDHTEETRSDSTTTHANYSLPEYDSFLFEIEPDQEGLISIDNSNDSLLEIPEFESFYDPSFPRPPPEPPDVKICLHFEPDAPVIDNFNELNDDQRGSEIDFSQNVKYDDSFTFIIRTFLPFLTYPEVSPLYCSTGSEDTIFDPDIST